MCVLFCLPALVDQPDDLSLICLHEHRHTPHRVHTGIHNRAPICLKYTLPGMTATHTHIYIYTYTHTHTHTHTSEINFNSPVREQISRQPFISSASLTPPLHCLLFSIDLCHSLVVLVSVFLSLSSSTLSFNVPLFAGMFSVHLSFFLFTASTCVCWGLSPSPSTPPFCLFSP